MAPQLSKLSLEIGLHQFLHQDGGSEVLVPTNLEERERGNEGGRRGVGREGGGGRERGREGEGE